ncbi:MAG: histidine--tRNA ligase [Halobacteriovoraceae bacterium]|nr:histidine--tRNA ligase [Halobacteriovoraceae bacterium]
MALNKKPYRGCRDFYPENMRIREYLFDQMKNSAHLFGYEPYDGPLLEEVELYKAKSGEELINDQIYSFTDRGERFVAIRPEMTPTLARMVANIHRQESKPIRWYSIPNLMRYEKPQRGRVREHWQFNVDIFGAAEGKGELEILSLIRDFLKSFGADHSMFSIRINDRMIVDHLMNQLLKLDEDSSYKLYKIIDRASKVTTEKLNQMIDEIITDSSAKSILNQYLGLDSFAAIKTFIKENNIPAESFLNIVSGAEELELLNYLEYDPAIVRGLDYYTGLVFEIFDKHPDNKRAIAGGGAYANLLKIFNEEPLGGIGFGLGDVTLKDFLESHGLLGDFSKKNCDLFVVTTEEEHELSVIKLANELRTLGCKTEAQLEKLKFNKIFKLAEQKGFSHVAMIESKDNSPQVQLRDLKTREIQYFSLEQAKDILKAIKG